ncbi:MAG TPA: hypothetical protein DDZ88_24030 [Verrucomicrobiales bacterium]|nr:hypothetical protein [Verrucomicrobiales bacterium]
MKLVRLYSNETVVFPAIPFNTGLNVILAKVRVPEDETKSDHNLGKTLLTKLLDFMLLKDVDADFFTRKHPERFEQFVFFLEVLLPDGVTYATIRRAAKADTKIALKKHSALDGRTPLLDVEQSDWDHWNVPISKAQDILNGWLAFDAFLGWDYRKGISYFLRTQNDYRDLFRVEKFQRGRDDFWKPYMADLLGLPGALLTEKYEADRTAEGSDQAAKLIEGNSGYTETDADRLSAEISLAESSIQRKSAQLQEFSFHDMEMEVSEDLVKIVDAGIGRTEQEIYYLRRDLQMARNGLANALEFDLKEIKEIYDECAIALPEILVRSYDELVAFNRKLANERNKYLKRRIATLEESLAKETQAHKDFSEQRQRHLAIFKNRESFERFKKLQLEVLRSEENLRQLRQHLSRVEEMMQLREAGQLARLNSQRISNEIKKSIHAPSSRYRSIRERFQKIADEFLNVPAVLFVKQNEAGNLDFNVEVKQTNGLGEFSSEADGTTFKKLLCMAFDLAILAEYSGNRFYHFIYHDGALEGEDDRKKLALLKLVDELCSDYGIQYILSAIQHELPRHAGDVLHEFAEGVIVRSLHDDGDDGRLFRMPIF